VSVTAGTTIAVAGTVTPVVEDLVADGVLAESTTDGIFVESGVEGIFVESGIKGALVESGSDLFVVSVSIGILIESIFAEVLIESVFSGVVFGEDAVVSTVDEGLSDFGAGPSVALYGVLQAANEASTATTKKTLSFIYEIF